MGGGEFNAIGIPGLVALALGGLWLLLACAVAVIAARRLRRSAAVLSSARSLQSLLDAAPAPA